MTRLCHCYFQVSVNFACNITFLSFFSVPHRNHHGGGYCRNMQPRPLNKTPPTCQSVHLHPHGDLSSSLNLTRSMSARSLVVKVLSLVALLLVVIGLTVLIAETVRSLFISYQTVSHSVKLIEQTHLYSSPG